MRPRLLPQLGALLVLCCLCIAASTPSPNATECKVINDDGNDESLKFKQYTPRETVLRELLRRSLTAVRKVAPNLEELGFEIKGEDVKERVGKHSIKITLQPEGECFQLFYVITPVNECTAHEGIPWRHRCHESARCEDTEESYNCVCPSGYEGEQGTGQGRCTGAFSTQTCCGATSGDACKHSFICTRSTPIARTDNCKGQCVETANCARISQDRDLYSCVCPEGYFGNARHCARGHEPPPAFFDEAGNLLGKLQPDEYCGCQLKVTDWCMGKDCGEHAVCQNGPTSHRCVCDAGYVLEDDRCVDKSGVTLVLEGPEVVTVVQGDAYEDRLVRIVDENGMLAEPRYISISYDSPALNADTLDVVGTYSISYTVKAPWTSTPTVTIRRTIIVKDLNECTLRPTDPKWDKWRPRCHKWAQCSNDVGSYNCACRAGTVGDGAEANATRLQQEGTFPPRNIKEGTGCKDVQAPILSVSPWEKTFPVCKCEGLGGPGSPVPPGCASRDYGKELGDLITGAGEGKGASLLCTEGWPCFDAYDDMPDGTRQNLTDRVVVGPETHEEVEKRKVVNAGKETRFFVLPLSVEDDAGNKAESQLRFSVEEVSLFLQMPPPGTGGKNNKQNWSRAPPRVVAPVVEVEEAEEEELQYESEKERKLVERKTAAAAAAAAAAVREASAHEASCEGGTEPVGEANVKEEEFEGGAVLLVIVFILFAVVVWIYTSNNNSDDGVIPNDIDIGGDSFMYQESPKPTGCRDSFGSPGVGLSPYASPRVYT